jgi:hypothetical protein
MKTSDLVFNQQTFNQAFDLANSLAIDVKETSFACYDYIFTDGSKIHFNIQCFSILAGDRLKFSGGSKVYSWKMWNNQLRCEI